MEFGGFTDMVTTLKQLVISANKIQQSLGNAFNVTLGPYGTALLGQMPGINNNTAATAGNIGEYTENFVVAGSAIGLTTSVASNLTSISLTPGDWNVYLDMFFAGNAATTVTNLNSSISEVSATLDTTVGRFTSTGTNVAATLFASSGVVVLSTGPTRKLLNATTTIYGVATANFAVNTCSIYGILRAGRRR